MIKVLCGVQQADAGTIMLDGQPAPYSDPAGAVRAGIVPVFPGASLVPDLTVAQNLVLGSEPRNRIGLINQRRMRRDAGRLLLNWVSRISILEPKSGISLADRQLVEIAKALSRNPRVLILDEATSALNRREVELVFGVIRHCAIRAPPSFSSPIAWMKCNSSATAPRFIAMAPLSAPSKSARPLPARSFA